MPARPTIDCTGTADWTGRCTECREIMFPHLYEAWQRSIRKPAERDGLLPVGVRRKARAR